MGKAKLIHSWEVKPYCPDDTYASRMILDSNVAGEQTVQINEGTLRAGTKLDGSAHEKSEIYYIVRGQAKLRLDDEVVDVKPGSLIFIPGGVVHALDNTAGTEDLVILTIWLKAEDNELYNVRLKEWGTAFKTIYDS